MLQTSKNLKDLNVSKIIMINYLGEAIDLTALFIQLNIYENLFAPCITGDILINDGINLLSDFPIICQEKIIISFANPDFKQVDLAFNVVNVSNIKNNVNNDKIQNYIIHFASKEIIKNRLTTVNKCIKGKVDDVILDLLTKESMGLSYNGGYKIEKSDSYINFVVPYWDPINVINYIADRAIPENGKYPTYLFYQDFDNYNFISYDSLINAGIKEKFYYAPANIPSDYSQEEKSKNINRYDISNYLNLLNMIDNNMFNKEYIEVDLTNKKYNTNKYDYMREFQYLPTLYDNEIIPKKNLDGFEYNEYNHGIDTIYNFSFDKDMKKFNKWYPYRLAWLNQIQSMKIKIETTENTNRRLGDLVEFNIPARERFDNGIKYSDYISGKFIISKIRHTIGNNSMGIATIELIKDSFSTKLPEGKKNG